MRAVLLAEQIEARAPAHLAATVRVRPVQAPGPRAAESLARQAQAAPGLAQQEQVWLAAQGPEELAQEE